MKVIEVKNFAFNGSKKCDKVYFAEGINNYMILLYMPRQSYFIFQPISYHGDKTTIDEIASDINAKIPMIDYFKTKHPKYCNILDISLGKAKFNIRRWYDNLDYELYYEQLKKSDLIPHERFSEDIKYGFSGYVRYDSDIEDFVKDLSKLNAQELRNRPEQLEIFDYISQKNAKKSSNDVLTMGQ